MKRQVIFIHGGDPHDSYAEYISYLKKEEADLRTSQTKYWRDSLQKKLGTSFEIILPRMPNSMNPKYLEWEIWFKKLVPQMNDGVVLIGHSLGAIFIAKYLSLNSFPKKIKGIFLTAPPFQGNHKDDPMADFVMPKDVSRLESYSPMIYLYHSSDDMIVQTSDFARYVKILPRATYRIFKDRGHFITPTFPELVKDIKNLYK